LKILLFARITKRRNEVLGVTPSGLETNPKLQETAWRFMELVLEFEDRWKVSSWTWRFFFSSWIWICVCSLDRNFQIFFCVHFPETNARHSQRERDSQRMIKLILKPEITGIRPSNRFKLCFKTFGSIRF